MGVEIVDLFEVVALIEVCDEAWVVKILGIDEDKFLNIASKTCIVWLYLVKHVLFVHVVKKRT